MQEILTAGYHNSNTAGCRAIINRRFTFAIMAKKKELSPEQKAECSAAKALFIARKNALGLTQAKLAEAAEISPAGAAMYLNGVNPLNAKFAAVLSRLVGEPVEKFSPRLAKEIESLSGAVIQEKSYGPGEAKESAAAQVMMMLKKHGKSLSGQAQERLLRAVSESLEEPKAGNVISADFSGSRLKPGELLIPQYDVRGSMGHGQVPADYTDFMRNVTVSGPQLEKLGLDYTSPANLAIISGWGQSMAPTIQDKDPVIVDRGVTDFIGDGVYVITWDGMLYIKRLQSAGDSKLELISDNPKHKDRVVNTDEVAIHARVLLVWNAQKL